MYRPVTVALFFLTACAAAQKAPSRIGPRPAFDRSTEIALARSAAPATVTDSARILVFTGSRYEVAVAGTNGVSCLVSRPWPDAVEPHCYDREGAETVMAIEMRKNELWHRGASDAEIERVIADGLSNGTFRLPRRPAMTYMMSAANMIYDDAGNKIGAGSHVMIYYPYLSNFDVGFPATPDMHAGIVDQENKPLSNLIILMPTSVPVRGKPQH
jgi:hypothetical protein